jgi:hypothetical protein
MTRGHALDSACHEHHHAHSTSKLAWVPRPLYHHATPPITSTPSALAKGTYTTDHHATSARGNAKRGLERLRDHVTHRAPMLVIFAPDKAQELP